MRPDRIIVGEVRGAEALDMLQAMNTGHDGSLCTLHANTPRDALARAETMVLMAGYDLPVRAIRQQISSALDLVVHLSRVRDGSRRVTGDQRGPEDGVGRDHFAGHLHVPAAGDHRPAARWSASLVDRTAALVPRQVRAIRDRPARGPLRNGHHGLSAVMGGAPMSRDLNQCMSCSPPCSARSSVAVAQRADAAVSLSRRETPLPGEGVRAHPSRTQRLAEGEVQVSEDGKPVRGLRVAPVGADGAGELGVVLAIDASSSMRGRAFEEAFDAARAFAHERNGRQPFALVTFGAAPGCAPVHDDENRIRAPCATRPSQRRHTHVRRRDSAP